MRGPAASHPLGKPPLRGLQWARSPPTPCVPLPPKLLLPVEILVGAGKKPRGLSPAEAGEEGVVPRLCQGPRAALVSAEAPGGGGRQAVGAGLRGVPGWEDGAAGGEALPAACPNLPVRPADASPFVEVGDPRDSTPGMKRQHGVRDKSYDAGARVSLPAQPLSGGRGSPDRSGGPWWLMAGMGWPSSGPGGTPDTEALREAAPASLSGGQVSR